MPDDITVPAAAAPAETPVPPAASEAVVPPVSQPASLPKWESDLTRFLDAKEAGAPDKSATATTDRSKPDDKAKPDRAGTEKPKAEGAEKTDKPEPPVTPRPGDKDDVPQFHTSKELRKWAQEQNRAARALEAEKKQLESKLREMETLVPRTQLDSKHMTEGMAVMQKQIAEYEKLLALHVFEQSPKYVNEFRKPFMDARDRAYREIEEYSVREATGEKDEDGNPVLRQRQATRRDFDYIYSLPRGKARQAAKELFGDDADDIMEHRRRINELAEKAVEAVEQHKKNYAQETEAEMARKTQERNATSQLWRTANEKISADPRFQQFWGESSDAEANKHLADGFQMADVFFSEERDKLPAQERVVFDANIRHRIASFSRLAYQVNKLTADLKTAHDTIEQMKGSAPGKPTPSGESAKPAPKGWLEALNQLPE